MNRKYSKKKFIEIDAVFTTEKRAESEKILAELKVPYQINIYGSVSHGFALRADFSIKEVKFAADHAFEQAVTWFKYWL
jgi:dienelactone hydrolase